MDSENKRVIYLSTPGQLFMKFDWDLDNLIKTLKDQESEFKSHEIAAYHAFNAAITAWHLTDWTWNYLSEEAKVRLSSELEFEIVENSNTSLKNFQFAVKKKSRALAICWDIGNGSKHFDSHKDSKVDAKVKFEVKHATAGEFRAGQPLQTFSYDFVVHWENQTFRLIDVFGEARDFWTQLLAKEKVIGELLVKLEFDIKITRSTGTP